MISANGVRIYPLIHNLASFQWGATTWTRTTDPAPWDSNCCLDYTDDAMRIPMNYEIVLVATDATDLGPS